MYRRGGSHVKTQLVYTLCKDMVYTFHRIGIAKNDSEGGAARPRNHFSRRRSHPSDHGSPSMRYDRLDVNTRFSTSIRPIWNCRNNSL